MRIAFDGTALRRPQTGVGYYTEHLLRHLLQVGGENEFLLLANQPVWTSLPLKGSLQDMSFEGRLPRVLWLQTFAPRVLRTLNAEVAHFTNSVIPLRAPCPTVVTIHDMSLFRYPEFHPYRRRFTRPLVARSASESEAVITVSKAAKNDIVEILGVSPEKVKVIYEAPAPEFQTVSRPEELDGARRTLGLPQQFVLFVGTLEPRKNLVRLLNAYRGLSSPIRKEFPLVLAGDFGWGNREVTAEIKSLDLQGSVLLLGYVPYQLLPAVYSLCTVFVFPSIDEGFGLPVAEAMACGAPVLTSATSALKEIFGTAASLADPLDQDSIGEELERLLVSPARRRSLSRLGRERVADLSWEQTARETLEVYRSVVPQPSSLRFPD